MLIQLTRDTKSDVSCLQTLLTRRYEDLQMTFGFGRHTTLIVNILFKTSIFQRIGKTNNQSSVSDADREIPILRSTDNAGNSVNLVSGIIRLPSGWDFSVCMIDSIYSDKKGLNVIVSKYRSLFTDVRVTLQTYRSCIALRAVFRLMFFTPFLNPKIFRYLDSLILNK